MRAEPGLLTSLALLMAAVPLLAGCSLFAPQLSGDERSSIDQAARPGMAMTTARANLLSAGFVCHTRRGSYFDANGEEHEVEGNFVSCDAQPESGFSFACRQRPHVVLVPNGERVARIVVDTAPTCTDISPPSGRQTQRP